MDRAECERDGDAHLLGRLELDRFSDRDGGRSTLQEQHLGEAEAQGNYVTNAKQQDTLTLGAVAWF